MFPGGFGTLLELFGLKDGGAEGNRTPDLDIANVALSQLSYGPKRRAFARGAAGGAGIMGRAPNAVKACGEVL